LNRCMLEHRGTRTNRDRVALILGAKINGFTMRRLGIIVLPRKQKRRAVYALDAVRMVEKRTVVTISRFVNDLIPLLLIDLPITYQHLFLAKEIGRNRPKKTEAAASTHRTETALFIIISQASCKPPRRPNRNSIGR